MKSFRKIFICAGILSVIFAASSPDGWAMAKRPPAAGEVKDAEVPKIILTITEAYDRSLRQSETVAISREAIAQTRADWLKAAGEAIGDGDLIMTDMFQDPATSGDSVGSVGGTLTSAERRERRMVFSQPIFQGFKTLGSVIGAGSLSKQRKEEYKRSKEVLFLDVSQAFYEYLRLREDLRTIEKTHGLFEERVQQLKEREEVGRSRISEIATARSRMKTLEAELARSRRLFSIAGTLLEFYTGIPTEEVVYKDLSLPEADLDAPLDPKAIASQRTDVKAAFQAMKTAKQALVVAQSDLWPTISMDATHYEMREGFQSGIDWDVLFKVNVPLYRGGTTLGEIKSKYSDWRKAKLNYSLTKRRAQLEIKEAYDNWRGSVEQDKAFKEAVRAAEENYKLQQEDYAKNLVNNLDVLDAMEDFFSTARDAHQAYYQMKQNYWRYKIAVGECCSVEALSAAGETENES